MWDELVDDDASFLFSLSLLAGARVRVNIKKNAFTLLYENLALVS